MDIFKIIDNKYPLTLCDNRSIILKYNPPETKQNKSVKLIFISCKQKKRSGI